MFFALVPVEVVHVHLHLAQVLVGQLAELEVDEDEAAQQPIVENQVDVEVIALEGEPSLSCDEAEALAELEQERLEAIDDRLLEVALEPRRAFLEVEELEDERVLHDILRGGDGLPLFGERQDLVLVAALRQPLEKERGDLTLQLTDRPARLRGLDLVEGAGAVVPDADQDEVVTPAKNWREMHKVRARFDQRC